MAWHLIGTASHEPTLKLQQAARPTMQKGRQGPSSREPNPAQERVQLAYRPATGQCTAFVKYLEGDWVVCAQFALMALMLIPPMTIWQSLIIMPVNCVAPSHVTA